jgi:uncharacterized protein
MTKTPLLNSKLIEMLVCPLTKGPLTYDKKTQELISSRAKLAYPIRDGVPVMLVEEARSLNESSEKPKKRAAPSKSA